MKRFLYALLLPILLVGCKKDDFEPTAQIKDLVGNWRLVATETTVNGQKVWENASETRESYLVFRFDGVILKENGNRPCCAPGSLIVNGVPFTIKPLAPVPMLDSECINVLCVAMPNLILQLKGDTLIVTPGIGNSHYRARYIRE